MLTQNKKENSRFIAFFDECGDHSLIKINPQMPVFVLCIVIVERKNYANNIIPRLSKFKLRYFPHEGINLHSRDIRKAQGAFSILQNIDFRESFLQELSEEMQQLPYTIFATAIRKYQYLKEYSDDAKNPYEIALEHSLTKVLRFMRKHSETHLPVIAESRGKNEDKLLKTSFKSILDKTNQEKRSLTITCNLSFHKKSQNILGIQIADLCAHPIARHAINIEEKSRPLQIVQKHFYKSKKIEGFNIFP